MASTVRQPSRGRTSTAASLALHWGAWLFVACLVLQFFFVGLDAFEAPGLEGLHRDFAYTYGWLAPILVLLAGLARAPQPVIATSVVLLVAFAIQTYLPLVASALPLIASVHAVLALAIVVVAVRLARLAGKLPDAAGTADR